MINVRSLKYPSSAGSLVHQESVAEKFDWLVVMQADPGPGPNAEGVYGDC